MNIAYLILAHHQPHHLSLLIEGLANPEVTFFVHLDREADRREFEHARAENVHFCEPRLRVHWGEYSQVEAILMLISEARASQKHHDYFVLLSGADYPLRSNDYIARFLSEHQGAEFINIVKVPNLDVGKSLDRLASFRVLAGGYTRRKAREALLKFGVIPDLRRDHRRYLGSLEPYAGSTWWALTRDACDYILRFASSEKAVMKFFRNTICPDETVFQTILGNSPFRNRVRRNLTYTDWSAGGASPATITAAHLDYFESSERVLLCDGYGEGEALFARKFSEPSSGLVSRIEKNLRRNSRLYRHQ